jgi:hypothetical protein
MRDTRLGRKSSSLEIWQPFLGYPWAQLLFEIVFGAAPKLNVVHRLYILYVSSVRSAFAINRPLHFRVFAESMLSALQIQGICTSVCALALLVVAIVQLGFSKWWGSRFVGKIQTSWHQLGFAMALCMFVYTIILAAAPTPVLWVRIVFGTPSYNYEVIDMAHVVKNTQTCALPDICNEVATVFLLTFLLILCYRCYLTAAKSAPEPEARDDSAIAPQGFSTESNGPISLGDPTNRFYFLFFSSFFFLSSCAVNVFQDPKIKSSISSRFVQRRYCLVGPRCSRKHQCCPALGRARCPNRHQSELVHGVQQNIFRPRRLWSLGHHY